MKVFSYLFAGISWWMAVLGIVGIIMGNYFHILTLFAGIGLALVFHYEIKDIVEIENKIILKR